MILIPKIFCAVFPDDLLTLILDHTNCCAQQWWAAQQPLSEHCRMKAWRATTADEIEAFVSIEIVMSLTVMADCADHCSQNWLVGAKFGKMPYNRFTLSKCAVT